MRKLFCKIFGWHTPNASLDINLHSHCKYCGRDIVKIKRHWLEADIWR